MAKGSRGRRDAPRIANGTLPDPVRDLLTPAPLSWVEDLRRVDPVVHQTPLTVSGRRSRVVPLDVLVSRPGRARSKVRAPDQFVFVAPREVVVCVKRKQRREVLHAKGKAGGKVKPPRRGPWSSIHCRRK